MQTLYLDVDTQQDFVFSSGALYVPGAERILERVAELNREAIAAGHLLIATMDAHGENDPEFAIWPHHCVKGSLGQRKPVQTLVEGMRILEKQSVDCFSNPDLDAILRENGISNAVVYGVVTEICVQNAARGLLDRGVHVTLIENAMKEFNGIAKERYFAEHRERGGVIR